MRHTSRKLGIRNETVLRSEKLLAPELTEIAIQRAVQLILELAGGEYYDNQDWYPKKAADKIMNLRYSRIEKLSGKEPNTKRVKEILKKLGYEILEEKTEGLGVKIPYFRTDVLVEDDIVADFLRISNYENIKTVMLAQAPPKNITSESFKIKEELRQALVKVGGDEYITNPLIPTDENIENQIKLENALSEEQSALRTDIKQTLGVIGKEYEKRGKEGVIFELGRVYLEENGNYKEDRRLTVIQAGKGSKKENNEALKVALATLLSELNINDVHYKGKESGEAEIYQADEKLGHLDWNSFTLYIGKISEAKRTRKKIIREHTNVSTLDISLLVSEVKVESEYKGEGIQEDERSILLSIRIEDKNLTTEGIQNVHKQLLKSIEAYPQITIRN